MQKTYYETDPFNRLVINNSGTKSGLQKFRKILDGRFCIDGNNNLSYRIKSPLDGSENIPHQFRLDGSWSLGDNHELKFTLDKEGRRTFGDQLTIQGRILDVGKSSLLFSVTTRSGVKQSTYVLDLQGSWNADEKNRLSFRVKRESGRSDTLTLDGTWSINKYHQIAYQYKKASSSGKKKEIHTLIFSGYWDIKEKARISYLFSGDSDSGFDFKTSAGVLSGNCIKYEAGIGLASGTSVKKQTIALYGKWKLKRNAGLLFEIKYEGRKCRAILFGADVALKDGGMVSFKLKSGTSNEYLGMEFEMSDKILDGTGEIFLRALALKHELAFYAGAAWRW
ncbi:MAG: hypothetical protein WCY36_01620 [Candidatus Omnitrophota bacterium]